MARLLIIDPQPLCRLGIETALSEAGHEIVGMADDGLDGLDQAREKNPALIVLDLDIPRLGGLDVIKRLHSRNSQTKTLVLTSLPSTVYEHLCIAAGASGFISKTDPQTTLADAVRRILAGHSYFSVRSDVHDDVTQPPLDRLSAREVTVLHYLADGYRVKQIAGEMALSDRTVSTYKTRLLDKLGASSLVELLQVAGQRGLLERKETELSASPDSSELDLRFSALLDAVPFPICLRSPDGRIQAVNEAFTKLMGFTKDEVLQTLQRDLGVIDPEHLDYYRKTFDAAVANKTPYMMVVTIYVHGQRKVMRHSGCPIIDESGTLVGMLCSSVDLDDESRIIQSLRDEVNALQTLKKRRGSYLMEQQAGISRDASLAVAAIQREGSSSLQDTAIPLLQGIIESVTLVGDLARLEENGVIFSPYPQNLNEITLGALTRLPATTVPRYQWIEAPGVPMAWVDSDRYVAILKVLMLHLASIGAESVAITSEAFEPHPSSLQWRLYLRASVPGGVGTIPVIYLALASELCLRLNGELAVEAGDPELFKAMVTLNFATVAPER